ncbi:MAG: exodeoxyribonuclease VII large subunit [Bacilli bacterium]|jgi:exodeoxyribonuclease VII large subunit
MNEKTYFTVSEINNYVNSYLASNRFLNNVAIRGEIINYTPYRSAHYFTLKGEDDARIAVVLFYEGISSLEAPLKNGDDVIVTGSVSLYVKGGTYQLIGSSVTLFGEGQKLLALKKLKEKLAKQGIFDEYKKLPLPKFPRNIGLIVGKDSAALADVKENLIRRYPLINLYIFYSLVQGDNAPESIMNAYDNSQNYPLDVLIIARGGGSSDDLWAFNDEKLIMHLANRKVPIISAVGHEIDKTLIDYLADVSVSTPTKAVEVAVPSKEDLLQDLIAKNNRLNSLIKQTLNNATKSVNFLLNRPLFTRDEEIYHRLVVKVNELNLRLKSVFKEQYQNINHLIVVRANSLREYMLLRYNKMEAINNSLINRLNALSPTNVLKRGYGLVTNEEGELITSITNVKTNETIVTTLSDGQVYSVVKEKKEDGK